MAFVEAIHTGPLAGGTGRTVGDNFLQLFLVLRIMHFPNAAHTEPTYTRFHKLHQCVAIGQLLHNVVRIWPDVVDHLHSVHIGLYDLYGGSNFFEFFPSAVRERDRSRRLLLLLQ